jgi:FemAB-related protein (PEP-CTERM system-associated)
VAAAYGLRPRYLACRGPDGALTGLLPLAEIRTLRGSRELVSLPFHDVAGVLASRPEAGPPLVRRALEIARERRCAALELRQAAPLPGLEAPGAEDASARVNLVLPLAADEAQQWSAIGAKVRNQVRKAQKEGLTLADWDPEALLDGFYECFAANMRDLGSPAHARRFFAEAAKRFGARLRFVVAADGARAVGGLVAIHYARRVTVTWASTLRAERPRCPNYLIYWEALRWALGLGATHFDFGRSPIGAGTYRFKRGWGAEESPLAWTHLSPAGDVLRPSGLRESRLFVRLSAVWQRLPVGVTRALGPALRRHLPQ